MSRAGKRPRRTAFFRYGLAFVSVGTALVLTIILLHFDSPLPLTAFALSAIAVTFWYGGTNPGIVAVFLSTLARSYFFRPAILAVPRMLYDSAFLVFALVMIGITRTRNELEVRVAERTAELARANEDLKLEIAERKQAEDRLRLALDTTPCLIHSSRIDGYLDYFNKGWLKYVGLSLEDLQGWGWTATIHPEDVEGMVKKWRASLASGEPFSHEARVRRADGEYRWMLHRKAPLHDVEGNVVKWYGTSSDIEDLKRTEDRIRLIIDTIPTMAWSLRPDGAVDFVNQRWLDYTGLSLEEEIKEPTRAVHPEDLSRVIEKWLVDMAAGEPSEDEMRLRRADGEYRWFLVRTAPLRDEHGNLVKWYGLSVDIEDRKQAEEQVRRLSGQLLRSQDEERRRIARELHDSTGQNLVALATMLGQLNSTVPAVERKSHTLLSECRALADQCIREVRTLSYVLHSPVLEEAGLEDAIRDYARGFTNRSGIHVELDLSPRLGRMPRDIEFALFRVVQEALTNIQRHSGSQQAKIRIHHNANLTLEVSDRGHGVSGSVQRVKERPRFEIGVGIPSMQERVNLIGGKLDVDSTKEGTTVRVTIPLGGQRT